VISAGAVWAEVKPVLARAAPDKVVEVRKALRSMVVILMVRDDVCLTERRRLDYLQGNMSSE